MENQLKNLTTFVESIVSNFAYEDFMPPTEKEYLRDGYSGFLRAVRKVLVSYLHADEGNEKSPYWVGEKIDLPPNMESLPFAIKTREFENFHNSSKIIIFFVEYVSRSNDSILKITAQIRDATDSGKDKTVSIRDVWLDHKKLSDFLIETLKTAGLQTEEKRNQE